MPDVPLPDPTKPEDLRGQAAQSARGWLDVIDFEKTALWLRNTLLDVVSDAIGIVLAGAAKFGAITGTALAKAENRAQPQFNELASVAVQDLFGVSASVNARSGRGGGGGNKAAANEVGDMLFKAFAGGAGAVAGGELRPSDAPAKAFLSTMTQLALEGWLEGWLVELLSAGQIEQFGELDDIIAHVLGLGRASAAVHGPLVRDLIVTPLEWKLNLEHRPQLLSTALAVRQFLRGKLTREQLDDELGRQGWAPKRIDALVHESSQRFTDAELERLVAENIIDDGEAIAKLKDNGWPEDGARRLTDVWRLHRVYTYREREASAIASGYISGEIDQPTFSERVSTLFPNDEIRNSFKAYADHARAANVKHLSHAEIRDCVERGIANPVDYRAWLRREGYAPDDAVMLELLLTSQLRGQAEAAKKKKEIEDERADAKRIADEQRAARAAELAAKKARTPAALSDIERAVVRGILPIGAYDARLVELHYAPEDRAFMVDLLNEQRDDYLAAQEKRQHAGDGDPDRALTIAEAERATVRGVISVDDYRRRLVAAGLTDADAAVLVALVQGDVDDRRAAAQKRREAEAAAARKGLSLAQQEKLVRQGLRSADQYGAWLRAQGFASEEAALLVASLVQDIAEARAAARLREQVNQKAALRGIGLAPLERAVKLDVRSIDEYAAKLVALDVSPDDQVTLMGVLRAELAQLEAARQKRAQPSPRPSAPGVTREQIERAVVDGIASMDDYRAYLRDAGYSDDDVDLLVNLLLVELQDARASTNGA